LYAIESITHRYKSEGTKLLFVRFYDYQVEVKDLGEHWLNRARHLVVKKWGKRKGRKIWKRQLHYKRKYEGNI